MSATDPTQPLPPPAPPTNPDLYQLLKDAVREVLREEVLPRLTAIETRLDRLETRVAAIEIRLDALETRVAAIETRLDALETRVAAIETRLAVMEERLGRIEEDVRDLRRGMRQTKIEVYRTLVEFDERLQTAERSSQS